MSLLNRNFFLRDSALVMLYYAIGVVSIFSFPIIQRDATLFIIPLILSARQVVRKGKTMIPLFGIISLISHFSVYSLSHGQYFFSQLFTPALSSLGEIISVFSLIFFDEKLKSKYLKKYRSESIFLFINILVSLLPFFLINSLLALVSQSSFDLLHYVSVLVISSTTLFLILKSNTKPNNLIDESIKAESLKATGSILFTLEQEISRQVNEYRELNNRLFEEIEKRGIAERELAQSKKLLLEAQEYSGIATWEYSITDETFKWVSYNPNFPIIDFELEKESIKSLTQRIHPEDVKYFNRIKDSFSKSTNTFEIEIRLQGIDGNYKYYMLRGSRNDNNPKQIKLYGLIMDINDRKLSEKLLAEREQKFRAFFESDLIGMAEISISKDFVSFNDNLVNMLGYSPKELSLMNWDEITYHDDLKEETKLFNRVLTLEDDKYFIEKRFVTKVGELIDCEVSLSPIRNTQGANAYFIVLVKDISYRKKIERALRENQMQLSYAQEVAKLGSIRFYPQLQSLTLSDEAYNIFGYSHQKPSISRKEFFSKLIPNRKIHFEEVICNLEKGIPYQGSFEQSIVDVKNQVRHLLVNFGLLYDQNEKVKEVLVTMADVTPIKNAEIALQEANVLKDQLFSIISHDLKSPIASINQLVELYERDRNSFDEETKSSILQTLKTSTSETYKLLENLLEWATAQRRDFFKPEKVNLSDLINQVVALCSGNAKNKGVEIKVNKLQQSQVFVDVQMVSTALRNLVSNSIKFTPLKGTVSINLEENDKYFTISVSDTGVGIPANAIDKLFDNNTNYSTLGTNNEKGTGLGLKLVKKFVEKNGGEITVQSTVGLGTKFSFTIPKSTSIE